MQHERLTGWYEIFGPITKRSKAKLNKSWTLKIALKQWITSSRAIFSLCARSCMGGVPDYSHALCGSSNRAIGAAASVLGE